MAGDESNESSNERIAALLAEGMAATGVQPLGSPSVLAPIAPFNYATAEDHQVSLTPKEMLARYPYADELSIKMLFRELSVARVVALAEHAVWRRDGETSQSYFLIVPSWVWMHEIAIHEDFWETAYLEQPFPTNGYMFSVDHWIKLFNVRFWIEPDETGATPKWAAHVATQEQQPAPTENRTTGRPRKEYWEAALIEMFERLWLGTLTPTKQADIERAMADWISAKYDERPSEQSIRSRSSKIWKSYKKEG